jgi:hypothetical protein
MGKSLYTYLAERLSRCRLNVGRYGLCYLIRRMLKWTKMIVRDFLNFLKKLKSKLFGERKKEQKLEEE